MTIPVTVVFVMGREQSGASSVRHLIAQKGGIAQLGEVQNWPDSHDDASMCSCGKPTSECEFWEPVLSSSEKPEDLAKTSRKTKSRAFLASLLMPEFLKKLLYPGMTKNLFQTYDMIRSTHGRDIVMDSSSNPAYGAALADTPGLDVVFFHVVRHPLAVVYAWKTIRQTQDETSSEQNPKSLLGAALEWTGSNLLYELTKFRSPLKSTFVRAERLGDPSLQEILVNQVDIMTGGAVQTELTHIISGAPAEPWAQADAQVNEEWRSGLTFPEKLIYGALTYPLYVFYMRRPDFD